MKLNTFAKSKIVILLIYVLFILLAIGLTVWFLVFCRIKTVEVQGNINASTSEIIQTSNIKLNSHIYSINEKQIENDIISKNAYVSKVEIRKYLPSKISINITEQIPTYYTYNNNTYYVLSRDLRILTVSKLLTNSISNYIELKLPKFNQNSVGEYITYDNSNLTDAINFTINSLDKSPILSGLKSIDMTSRFDISANYKGFYTIVFGDYNDFDKKLVNCINTISYLEKNKPGAHGTIYSYKATETSFEEMQ